MRFAVAALIGLMLAWAPAAPAAARSNCPRAPVHRKKARKKKSRHATRRATASANRRLRQHRRPHRHRSPSCPPKGQATGGASPWPSMRHDSRNTGRGTIPAVYRGDKPWSFQTGRGLFITPVIDGTGTVYFGSADHNFYALNPNGSLRWKYTTGNIIDAAAALGPHNSVTIGSADENLYDFSTGLGLSPTQRVLWKYHATAPPATGQLVDWWEDDVSWGPDGNVYTGNTGGGIYSFTPQGKLRWSHQAGNSVWTMPAYGPGGVTYWGSVDRSIYALDAHGQSVWSSPTLGFVISSPALGSDGTLYIGSFDSKLYALDPSTGVTKWSFGTNDHIYSSPALEQDSAGHTTEIYAASTDGSVYALDPSGHLLWTYDTGDVIRSSPVLGPPPPGESHDILYFGDADGSVYALDAVTGKRRWSFNTTSVSDPVLRDRNDLNSSPALGTTGVYIGSEDGNLTYVPYDYCLHRADSRCNVDPGEPLGQDVSRVFPVSAGGNVQASGTLGSGAGGGVPISSEITARLLVRQAGRTVYAAMQPVPDTASLVKVNPPFAFDAQLSGDGRFLFITPKQFLSPNTTYSVNVAGQWSADGQRVADETLPGTGTKSGAFNGSFTFRTAGYQGPVPLSVGSQDVSAFELKRLAVPLPAFLPSVNQIGFDSYNLIVAPLAISPPDASGRGSILLWAIGSQPGAGGAPTGDPKTTLAFPLAGTYDHDMLLLTDHNVTLTFSFGTVPIQRFDMRAQLSPQLVAQPGADLYAEANCLTIPNYGAASLLTGVCNQQAILAAEGTFITNRYPAAGGANRRPPGLSVSKVTLQPPGSGDGSATARFSVAPGASYPAAQHRAGILLVDDATGGPVSLDYTKQTTSADAAGNVSSVTLDIPQGTQLPAHVRAYVLADVFPLTAQVVS